MSADCRVFVRVSLPVLLLLGVVSVLDPMVGEIACFIAFILAFAFLLTAAICGDFLP